MSAWLPPLSTGGSLFADLVEKYNPSYKARRSMANAEKKAAAISEADSKAVATSLAPSSKRCKECGTKYNSLTPHCKPLSERQGPKVGSPSHPGTDGSAANLDWQDYMNKVGRLGSRFMRNGEPVVGFVSAPPVGSR